MKKILLICLLLCSTPLLAYDDRVIVTITNATDADCVLKEKTLLYGQIFDDSPLPDAIFRDQTIVFRMHSSTPLRFGARKDIMFLLTYHCADNQEATLFSHIFPFQDSFFAEPHMSSSETATQMHAKSELISTYPLQVHWTLTKK